MKAETFNVNELAERLQGTCDMLNNALEELYPDMDEDDLTMEDCQELDNLVFCCADCNWWCEMSEVSEYPNDIGEDVCEDCGNAYRFEDHEE